MLLEILTLCCLTRSIRPNSIPHQPHLPVLQDSVHSIECDRALAEVLYVDSRIDLLRAWPLFANALLLGRPEINLSKLLILELVRPDEFFFERLQQRLIIGVRR